jgi:hypothetical protein
MADKKISQLVERLTTAATDVFPVVYVGATETQKVKASTIFQYIKSTLITGIIQATTDTDKFLVQDGSEIKYRTGSEMLGDILPTQTGNAGKVLKTDGTSATWQDDATANTLFALPFSTDHLAATGNQYVVGDVVYYSGNVYECIATNDSIIPTSTTYWTLLGAGKPLVQQPTDWNSTSGNNQILNKPTIPAAQVNSDWNATSGVAEILNKPTIPSTPSLQQVTDVGLQTNDSIKLENGFDIFDPANSVWIEVRGGDGFIAAKITGGLDYFLAEVGNLGIGDGTGKFGVISSSLIPALTQKIFNLPAISGSSATLVTSVNGTSAGTNGNVTIPTGATLTLQDVTDNGNTTTDGIVLGVDGVSVYDPFIAGHIEIKGNNGLQVIQQGGVFSWFEVNGSQLKFGEAIKGIFDQSILTASRTYNLPNSNGTLVLSVNGTSPNSLGDISIPVGGSQTLQQTTDLGNTTTNDIEFIDAGVIEADYVDYKLVPTSPVVIQEGRTTWNDDLKTLQVHTENIGVQIDVGHDLIQRVVNNTGVTINKGSVVYINGQQGGRPTITLADNSSDLTSATTFGIVMANIPNNQNGYVITNGLLSGINTSTFTAGQQLYLGTSGAITGIKPVQPLHAVYIAKVISVSVTGSIFVTIQNGLELEELHDVLITSPANDQILTYETSTGLWKNKAAPLELPQQSGNSGKFLFTNGVTPSWSFPSRHYKLGFNNISDYVVNGGAGTQNLGVGTLGMSLTQDLQSMLYAISGTNYVINCKVIAAEQFGGVTNQLGLRVTYSSANGVFSTDQMVVAARTPQFGSNFAIQTATLNFTIPIQYNGANTDYFKFEVIMNRTAGGSTSVFHSELIFSV